MGEQPQQARHASWLELFFDLVVVVAVAQLAHRLQSHEGDPGWTDVLVFAVLYFAIWLVWSSFTPLRERRRRADPPARDARRHARHRRDGCGDPGGDR